MIGNITKGGGVKACLSYVLNKEKAKKIGGNLEDNSPDELAYQFHRYCAVNPRVSRLICHISLSVKPEEEIDEDTWCAIAEDYLERMEFGLVPYIVVQHHDTEHHHVHIVAGRVRVDGTCVSDKWDFARSQKTLRWLEDKYGLYKSPTRQYQAYQPYPEEQSVFQFLRHTIAQVLSQATSVIDFLKGLKEQQIEPQVVTCRQDTQIKGIRYQYQDVSFSGTELGADYTWKRVNQGVNSIVAIPPEFLGRSRKKKEEEEEIPEQPQISEEASSVAVVAETSETDVIENDPWPPLVKAIALTLEEADNRRVVGEQFTYYRSENGALTITRNEDHSLVFQAVRDSQGNWQPISLNFREKDYNILKQWIHLNQKANLNSVQDSLVSRQGRSRK